MEKFCLRWNDFESNISSAFRELREDKDFFDVTLACDDDQLQAHKVILSACSPFFRCILRRNKHEHPLLYLKGVKYSDLTAVLNFMYHGEVNVAQEELNSFLAVAEDLKVKGLTQNGGENSVRNSHKQAAEKPSQEDPTGRIEAQHQKRPAPPRHFQPSQVKQLQSAASAYKSVQDDEIQEVLPVKVEPQPVSQESSSNSNVLLPHTSSVPDYSSNQVNNLGTGVVADPNMDYDEYGDYEGYDVNEVGYDGGAMESSGMPLISQDGSKDFATAVSEVLVYDSENRAWQCNVCWMTNKDKARVRAHAEVHFKGFVHLCPHCGIEKKTSTALRMHVISYHKNK